MPPPLSPLLLLFDPSLPPVLSAAHHTPEGGERCEKAHFKFELTVIQPVYGQSTYLCIKKIGLGNTG